MVVKDGNELWKVHSNEHFKGKDLLWQPQEHGRWSREEYDLLEKTIKRSDKALEKERKSTEAGEADRTDKGARTFRV